MSWCWNKNIRVCITIRLLVLQNFYTFMLYSLHLSLFKSQTCWHNRYNIYMRIQFLTLRIVKMMWLNFRCRIVPAIYVCIDIVKHSPIYSICSTIDNSVYIYILYCAYCVMIPCNYRNHFIMVNGIIIYILNKSINQAIITLFILIQSNWPCILMLYCFSI